MDRVDFKATVEAGAIVVTVEGGLVQDVTWPPGPAKTLEVWDFDTEGEPDEDRLSINDKGSLFARCEYEPDTKPAVASDAVDQVRALFGLVRDARDTWARLQGERGERHSYRETIARANEVLAQAGAFLAAKEPKPEPELGPGELSDDQFRALARDEHHREGEVEIDDNAPVSIGNRRNGAYVQAWVWVYNDWECPTCGESGDSCKCSAAQRRGEPKLNAEEVSA